MILAIETSSPVTSVTLGSVEGAVLGTETSTDRRGHVEFLMPAIVRLVGERGLDALTGIAVGVGPGLFTSMRVGIATAKTLAITLERPLVGVCSLDAVVFGAREAETCAVINAYRDEVFAARYTDGERVSDPRAWNPADLAADLPDGCVLIGDGPEHYPETFAGFTARAGVPAADAVLAIGAARLARGEVDDATALEPLYVRRSDAEIKWDEQGVVIERPMRVKFKGEA